MDDKEMRELVQKAERARKMAEGAAKLMESLFPDHLPNSIRQLVGGLEEFAVRADWDARQAWAKIRGMD